MLILGIDVGTTNVKVALVEKTGEDTYTIVYEPKTKLLGEPECVDVPGAAERAVSQVFSTIEGCLSELEAADPHHNHLRQVRAIGICGQMHGCVMWKSSGGKLFDSSNGTLSVPAPSNCSNLITCQDTRCNSTFISSLPRVSSEKIPPVSAGYGCATLAWLQRQHPDSLTKFDRAGTVMDAVVSALCSGGTDEVVMSSQNATSWGYFDLESRQWQKELLEELFPLRFLPAVVEGPQVAGHLISDWHGMPQGTLVSVALGDLQCAVYATKPCVGEAVLNMGTASQICLIRQVLNSSEKQAKHPPPTLPPSVTKVPYFDGDQLLVAASLTGGGTIALFVDTLNNWLEELELPRVPFQTVYKRLMAGQKDKEESLKIDPRVKGERHVPDEKGKVLDITAENLSLSNVGSGIVRGLIENLRDMISTELMEYYEIKRVLGSGKILESSVFRETIEEVFHLPLTLRNADAPLGAAMAVARLFQN